MRKMIVNIKYRYKSHSTAAHYRTFMEVVKAVARQGSATAESVAIRANQENYSYTQLYFICKEDIESVM